MDAPLYECNSNLYRFAISDDTNSRALHVRVLARKPRLSNGLRVPTICPPTRRKSGGEIQFLDHDIVHLMWSRLRAPVRVASGSLRLLALAHQLNFPAAFAGASACAWCCVGVCARNQDAQAFGSASPRVGVGKWWARKKIPDQRNTIRSVERSTVESTRTEDCPGREGFRGEAQFQIYRLGTCPHVREPETREVFFRSAGVCS